MLSVKHDLAGQRAVAVYDVTGATEMKAFHRSVYATANTDTDSYDIYLPDVQSAEGLIYHIRATIANAKVVTVKVKGTVPGFSNLTLDANGDHVVLYSDGRRWVTLVNGIA